MGNHPPEVAGEGQKILYRNRCGVRLGAHNAPDGEEAHNLFWAWDQIAPLLAYVQEDPTWQAIVGVPTLLRTLYSTILVVPCPSCRPVAAVLREHCCGESDLFFLKEACDAMLESADACGVGLAAVSGDVVESVNYILKKRYNGHGARGGGVGKSASGREAMVVQQVWECWFLTFDLPLLHYPQPTRHLRPSFLTLRPSMDAAELRKLLEESQKATLALVVCCLSRLYCVDNSAFIKPKLPS